MKSRFVDGGAKGHVRAALDGAFHHRQEIDMQKTVLIIAAVVIVAIAGAAVMLSLRGDPRVELSKAMLNIEGADIGGPFTLVRQDGTQVTSDQVITKPSLIYFGYTYCPDVCPVDVQVMVDAVDRLAEKGIDVQPVFISVDPARDTPKELSAYAEAMHPKMVALSGSDAQLAAAAKAYKVVYRRQDVPGSAAEYLMQHTTWTYLVLPGKGLVAMFRNGFPPEMIADDVERVLKAYSN